MATANVIGIPSDDKAFEEKCVPLFRKCLNDPNFKMLGTSGAGQSGIDLIGRRDRDPLQPVGVQCKLITRGGKLTSAEVKKEVVMALNFQPPLTEYYIVTTARDDLALESLALELSQDQAKLGRKIDIQVWGWDTLQQRIRSDPEALRAFDPDYSASTNELLTLGSEVAASQKTLVEQNAQGFAGLHSKLSAIVLDTEKGVILEAHLDAQIDQYRDLLNQGKPLTALGLLEKLEAGLPASSSAAIRARIRANLGFANLKLGDQIKAGALLEEAYVLNPTDAKVRANRILALATNNSCSEAFAFGRTVLTDDPTNAGAGAMIYQIASDDAVAESPDDIVPVELREDLSVQISRLQYFRGIEGDEGWWSLAAEALNRFPNDTAAKRYAAEALIDEALRIGDMRRGPALPKRHQEKLVEGASLLQDHWDTVRHYENASHEAWALVGCNLITAYRALGDLTSAMRTRDELAALRSTSPEVAVALANLAMDLDDEAEVVRQMLPLPESPMRTTMLLAAWSRGENWAEIVDFATPERRGGLSDDEAQAFDAISFRGRHIADTSFKLDVEVDALLSAWPLSVGAHVTVADVFRRVAPNDHPSMSAKAKSLLTASTSYAERVMLAQLSLFSHDWDGVILALDGYVSADHATEPLEWLAVAFANGPVRPRTRQFFLSLPDSLIRLNQFARLAGAAENARGDLAAAEAYLRDALSDDPTDLRAHLLLISAIERDDRGSDVRSLLEGIDEASLQGALADRMRLAVLLRRYGFADRAMALGYDVAASNRGNESVVTCYPTLVFFDENLPEAVGRPGPAGIGYWISLKGEGTPDTAGVIDQKSIEGVNTFAPDHPLATALEGRAVGEVISLPAPYGPDRRYTITEIKHKFLWLLHDIMETHAARFPDDGSMFGLNMEAGDVTPVLSVAKDMQKQRNVTLELYREHPIPAAALAAMANQSVVSFAEHLAATGETFRTCIGSLEEREEAEALARQARGKGVVLDTITFWLVYRTGLFPALKDYFGRVCIGRSTVDELLEIRNRAEFNRGREYMTISFDGDQPWRTVHTTEETEANINTLSEAVQAAQSHCEILPTDGAVNDQLAKVMKRIDAEHISEPINLAKANSLTLLSDDLPLRQIAAMEGVGQSLWLQPLARTALEEDSLSVDEYLRLVGVLAALKHDHVCLDVPTLVGLLTGPEFGKAWFETATEFIGGPKADMKSHLSVATGAMLEIWTTSLPGSLQGWASSRLLDRLISERKEWKLILQAVYVQINRFVAAEMVGALGVQRYFLAWMKGHFFDIADVMAARPEDLIDPKKLRRARSKPKRSSRG